MGKAKRNRGAIWAIVAVIAVVIVGSIAFAGKNYYDSRYTGTTYYARVPENANIEVQDLLDMNGKPVDKGHEYALTGYDEDGNSLPLEFTVMGDKVEDLYAPGTYVRAEANPSIVVYQEPISENEVPTNVLPLLSK